AVRDSSGGRGLDANELLLQFVWAWQSRESRLARLLHRLILSDAPDPLPLSGVYLAGTGRDPATGQAFVDGVFKVLDDAQNAVAWTPGALVSDADYRRFTRLGYAVLAVAVAAVVMAALFLQPDA
ncbi:MAG: hypothetical protein ACRC1K_21350, partial [Planctomycetia bacterium]